MIRKKIILTVIFSIFVLNLFAFEKFDFHVGKRNPPPPPPPRNNKYDDDADSFLPDLFVMLWVANNFFVTFDDYPYADGEYLNFFTKKSITIIDDSAKNDDTLLVPEGKEQSYRYVIDTGVFAFPSKSIIGNEIRIEGYIWKFFGPVLENTFYIKNLFSENQVDKLKGNLKLGGQISLAHSIFFDMSWFVQWTHWYDFSKGKQLNGANCGIIIRSYPANPVIIEYRFTYQDFFDDPTDTFCESHLELGIELNSPYEIYAAWKFTKDNLFSDQTFNGFSFGVKYNF